MNNSCAKDVGCLKYKESIISIPIIVKPIHVAKPTAGEICFKAVEKNIMLATPKTIYPNNGSVL